MTALFYSKGQAQQEQPTLRSNSKYDFSPGEKPVFSDDFTKTPVGEFPASWTANARGEVVTNSLYPGKWFKMTGKGSIALNEDVKLPDNYTIEFDVLTHQGGKDVKNPDWGFYIYSAANPKDLKEGGLLPGKTGIKLVFGNQITYCTYDKSVYNGEGEAEETAMKADTKYHLSFWVQKTSLRVWLGHEKIFDLPNAVTPGFQYNVIRFELWNAGEPMISNFRVATGL